uniref:Butyrophilin subfamily 1 member A1-like n=1 Tax=Neogobius melanostomus TaxID=47308 RepID=A0A8C6U3A1_9GOBI
MDMHFLFWLLGAFHCLSVIQSAPVSENFVVSVSSNVTVQGKHTVVLPCWLSPTQSAEAMEVNWFYQDQFDAPVMLYKDKTLNSVSQPASYTGRVSFGQKEASSGGLTDGDVSLKLVNVTLADAGKYTCYVSSEKHHDKASLNLIVTQTGESPLLTAVIMENNKVNVSCESDGWYPKPKLQWSDGSSALTPKALVHSTASTGLASVHSWLLVSSPSTVSCTVGLSGQEALEGRMRVQTPNSQAQEDSGSSVAGWVLFAVALVALVALLGFLFFTKSRGKDSISETADADGESEKLLPKDLLSIPNEAMANYANVQLVNSDNKFITIKNNILRDNVDFPAGDKVTCLTAVTGTPGFSSGKHYWEVSLVINGAAAVPPKQSWWIGVTNKSVIPKDYKHSSIADNGFWFLSSSPDNAGVLQFSSNPPTCFYVSALPRKIGVFLDYDGGTLQFYNAENRRRLGFFPTKFSGEVFPLFNPGTGDRAPMEIMQRSQDVKP